MARGGKGIRVLSLPSTQFYNEAHWAKHGRLRVSRRVFFQKQTNTRRLIPSGLFPFLGNTS